VTVSNADPVVSTPTTSGATACSVSVSASFTDAGSADTHTGSIAWGDTTSSAATIVESGGNGTASGSHTYTGAAGLKTITVTVTDDDTGSGQASTTAFSTKNTPSAFLPPINTGAGPRSVFKLGSTIPVKLTVRDCSNNLVTNLTPTVQLQKLDNVPDGTVNEAQISETPTNGKQMRWDGTQYIYNLSTKKSQLSPNGGDLTTGSYQLAATDPSFFAPTFAFFDLK
jgi:hypothetical protein